MPSTPLEPAGLLYAHYEVLRDADGSPQLLGSGGMGMTYKARDTRLDLPVALKIIHPLHVSHPQARRLFLREARAAARVIHANVAPVVYLHDEPGKFFYAMEFVDGVSLESFLRKRGKLPASQALGFAEQIARGLGAIHEQGLIHRDLKPANVMVTAYPAGHAKQRALAASGGCALKIIDFGLARAMEPALGLDEPQTIGFRGTPIYASPEQCEERTDLDARSDLYTLGCLLWQMLAGQPSFKGRSQMELSRQHCEAPLPWDQLPVVAPAVRVVLEALLAKNRDQRPADALQAAEMLAAARAGLSEPSGGAPMTDSARATSGLPGTAAGATARASGAGASSVIPATVVSPPTVAIPVRGLRWAAAVLVLLLVAAAGGAWWWATPRAPSSALGSDAPSAGARVVAVLPFQNLSGDRDSDFLADGIHEDVLAGLAKVRELRVVARSAVLKYRGRPDAAAEAARELGAALVLEGDVRRIAGRVRVSARLVETADSRQLWGDFYERDITDLFQIQAKIATEIASTLALNFFQGSRAATLRRPTANREAYEAFLRARSLQTLGDQSWDENTQVIALYEQAVRLDPDFALAWARLALMHTQMHWFGRDRTPARLAQAREAAERAARLQPDLPEARLALGDLLYRSERDWEGSMREYRVALAIEPGNAQAHELMGLSLRRLGRWDEALREFLLAIELAPDDIDKLGSAAGALFSLRRYAEAEKLFRRVLELNGKASMQNAPASCRLNQDGDWERFCRALRENLPRVTAGENRSAVLVSLREFATAAQELRDLPGPDLYGYTTTVAFPKELGIATVLRLTGQREEARRLFAEAARELAQRVQAHPEDMALRMKWARALGGAGDVESALRESAESVRQLPIERDAVEGYSLLIDHAELLSWLGRADESCAILERLFTLPGGFARAWVRHSPWWDDLRGNPRFEKLLAEP